MERNLSIHQAMRGNLSIHAEERIPIRTRYRVNFYDEVIYVNVTDNPGMVTRWLQNLEAQHRRHLDRLIVGLQVIYRRNVINPVTVLQLCVGDRCLVFQIFLANCEIPQKLREFFADDSYTFVGVEIQNEVEMLFRDHRLRVGGRIFELSALVAERRQYVGFRVHFVVRTLLTRSVERPLRILMDMSDWCQLDPERIMYTCLDPFVSCRIGQLLL